MVQTLLSFLCGQPILSKPNPNQGTLLIIQRVGVVFSFLASLNKLKSKSCSGNTTVRPGGEGESWEMHSQLYQVAIHSMPAASFVK